MKTLEELIAYVQSEINEGREVAYTSLRGTRGFLYNVDAQSFFLNYDKELKKVDKSNIAYSYAFTNLLGDDVDKYDYYQVINNFDPFQTMTIAVRVEEEENPDSIEQELFKQDYDELFEFSVRFRDFDNDKYSIPHPMGDLDDAFGDYYPEDIIKMAINGCDNFYKYNAPNLENDYFIIAHNPKYYLVTLNSQMAKKYLIEKMFDVKDSDEIREMWKEFKKDNC